MILKQKLKEPETKVGIRNYYWYSKCSLQYMMRARGIGLRSQFLYISTSTSRMMHAEKFSWSLWVQKVV